MWTDEDGSNAAKENGPGDRGNLGFLHAVAQKQKSIRAQLVRRQIVRLVKIDVVDLVAGDEGVDLERLVAVRNCGRDLLGLKDDVLAVFDLVSFDLLVTFDRIAGLAVNELALDPVSGLAVQRVESDPFRR